ncbi:hypothetical protein CPB83DRAFT_837187 [Crepidotus variabilis]|uniref:Uncharacterized protein n=1 Tax=Crepidotus variabilis TaxID=179855 RepID=A0A9P6ECY1_9AGAR|nr:hypothetical protein CPB83DRAFT_837187 [Crepidotus variabilis]
MFSLGLGGGVMVVVKRVPIDNERRTMRKTSADLCLGSSGIHMTDLSSFDIRIPLYPKPKLQLTTKNTHGGQLGPAIGQLAQPELGPWGRRPELELSRGVNRRLATSDFQNYANTERESFEITLDGHKDPIRSENQEDLSEKYAVFELVGLEVEQV